LGEIIAIDKRYVCKRRKKRTVSLVWFFWMVGWFSFDQVQEVDLVGLEVERKEHQG
jgi:hypothetical protein